MAAAEGATDNLTVARVPTVVDDNEALAAAELRTALAGIVPHHLQPAVDALIIAGPFGIGKRRLMQRMLTLYSDGFAMPPVYTSKADASGGQLQVVQEEFIDTLKAKGLLAFEETAVGERYVVSKEDIAQCGAVLCVVAVFVQLEALSKRNFQFCAFMACSWAAPCASCLSICSCARQV